MRIAIGSIVFLALLACGSLVSTAEDTKKTANTAKKLSKQDLQFFESRIRPILVEHCYSCHSREANLAEGGLRLDSAAAMLRGGSGGPSLIPGDPKASLIIKAVEYENNEYAMPPADAGGKLSSSQIADLTKWVKMGAPDPRVEEVSDNPKSETNVEAKSWWAFQPIQKMAVPDAGNQWAWNDIDRFIAKKQSDAGVNPIEDAAPDILLRRLYFDLIGLPPPVDRQIAFWEKIKSGTPRKVAIEQVVDELLNSDQFGAHWGRHWLDVARYGESSGRDNNLPYNNAWRYRDYVIDAFNRDMPFDMFLISQIAGDLMASNDEQEHAQNLIATGFLAVGSRGLNERNPKQFAVDQADEQIDAVFQSTMAFTLSCARCHDHKFDPVSQAEYTSVAGIFLSTETYFGAGGGPNTKNGTPAIDLPSSVNFPVALEPMPKAEYEKLRNELDAMRKEAAELAAQQKADKKDRKNGVDTAKEAASQQKARKLGIQAAELELKLSAFHEDGTPKAQAIAVSDKPVSDSKTDAKRKLVKYMAPERKSAFGKIDDSPLLARGDIEMPGKKIARGVPQLFNDHATYAIPSNKSGRLELANWIASDSNPMTSRVAVNRVWHWMMGQGIVLSVDNFGVTGDKPSHPELLDHLATQFQVNRWSIKKLIREIATSRTYQLSSFAESSAKTNLEKDPENRLCWKAKSRRLQAEEIRDAMLAATGTLDPKPQLATTLAKLNVARVDRVPSKKRAKGEVLSDDVCRSVYLSLPRSAVPEMLELFDLPDANAVQGAREATNVPSQSLYLLNNQSVATQAGLVAKAALKMFPGKPNDKFRERLEFVYARILNRRPNILEQGFAQKLISQSDSSESAWVSIVRGLFATAEFRYLD